MSNSTSTSTPVPLPATIIATIKVFLSPTDVPAFLELVKPVYDAVLQEPELAFFIMGQNPGAAGEVWWSEGWRFEESRIKGNERGVEGLMGEQVAKPYYKPFFEGTEKLFLKERQVEIFTPQPEFMACKVPA